jgi:hypothetical protein
MEMILFEEFFSEEEAYLLLSAISDIRHVSTYHKYNAYLQEHETQFDKLAEKITYFKKNKSFFEEWGIYDEKINLNKDEVDLLIKALDIALDIHSNDEFSTYVGPSKEFAYAVKYKCQEYQKIIPE